MARLTQNQKKLRRRIIEISYKYKLSHLSSTLTMVDILDEIYQKRKPDDPVILSNGHAGVALYAVLEKFGFGDADEIFQKHGVHPNRDEKYGIYCSTGSLGHGISIAVGLALANRSKTVFCTISDGELDEGNCWEALRIAQEQQVENLEIHANFNGFSAYGEVNVDLLVQRLASFKVKIEIHRTSVEQFPFLTGQGAHYYIMGDHDYRKALRLLK